MTLSDDIRSMMATSSALCSGPAAVTLASGAIVQALPGIATIEDTVLGGGTINGDEKTLRFVAVDVVGLKSGALLTWNSLSWRVKHLQLVANGALVKAFLQEALS